MKLKSDIGIDELSDSLFRIIIYNDESGETFAHVFGKTTDEVTERADEITTAFNIIFNNT